MGDKTAGAPQETIADVMVEMLCDSEGTTAQVPAWMAACKHYHDRLARAASPKVHEFDITTIPNDGVAVLIPANPILYADACRFKKVLKEAKKRSGSMAQFVIVNHGTKLEVLSDTDLARIGLQRIPAAQADH